MNLRQAVDESEYISANCVEFSHDFKYFSVALENGFKVFTAPACELYLEQQTGWNSGIATMLGERQTMALVKGGQALPNSMSELILWDWGNRAQAAFIKTKAPIIRCRLTQVHIALVFEMSVSLYRCHPKIERVASYETTRNPLGICCLGSKFLVFPGRTAGHIQIVELANLQVSIVPAHTSALRAMAVGPDESLVATGSQNVSSCLYSAQCVLLNTRIRGL